MRRLAVFLLFLPLFASAQAPTVPCEPSAEVQAAQDDLMALDQIRIRQPDNVYAHEWYQIRLRASGPGGAEEVIKQYRALLDQHPGDALYLYLDARALFGARTQEAIPLLEQALRANPDFPWPHFALTQIYSSANFRDQEKARTHVKAFISACPGAVSAYGYLQQLGSEDDDFIRENAKRLRTLVSNRTDSDALRAYGTLWGLEFRTRPVSEQEALKKQVAEDLKRLRALVADKGTQYLSELGYGYMDDRR